MPTVLFSGYDYPGLLKGFKDRGWVIHNPPEVNWYAWAHGNIQGINRASPAHYGVVLREIVSKLKPDLVILGKALDSNIAVAGDDPPWWRIRVDDIRYIKQHTIVFQLDLDSPDSFGWVIRSGMHMAVDAIGTCCVGTREPYRHHGQPHVFEFWPAWDQVLRAPVIDPEPVCDLILVGTPYLTPNEDFGLARRDIALAALSLGLKVEVYGTEDWLVEERGGSPALAECYRGLAPWETLHQTMSRAQIVYSSFLRRGFRYLNDRVPIAAGSGAFCLMEEQLGLEAEFLEGTMVGYHKFRDMESLKYSLTRWMNLSEARRCAAGRMQRHVLERHTYGHRADTLIAEYDVAKKRREADRRSCCKGG